MIEPIYLSRFNESPTIVIPKYISNFLNNYHILCIRFLFEAFVKKKKGTILNVDFDMNVPLQVSSLLAALLPEYKYVNKIIIVSHPDNVLKWMYHLKKDAQICTTLLRKYDDYIEEDTKECKVIVVSMDNLDLLKNCPYENLFAVIVEDFDLVANKILFRRMKGDFNIGITYKNFLIDRDMKMQYDMLHWINPEKYNKKAIFLKENFDHYINLRDAYNEDWLRLTWSFCESFMKTTLEQEEVYKNDVLQWSRQNNICNDTNVNKERRKRKHPKTAEKKPKKLKIENKRFDENDSDLDETSTNFNNSSQINPSADVKHDTDSELNETVRNYNNVSQINQSTDIKHDNDSDSDATTLSYDYSFRENNSPETSTFTLPCMDESPILDSIKKNLKEEDNLCRKTDTTLTQECILSKLFSQDEIDISKIGVSIPNTSKTNDDDNFLNSMILSRETTKKNDKINHDFIASIMDDGLESYEHLLDKNVRIDKETQDKFLQSLLD